jgi:hypothetical protein
MKKIIAFEVEADDATLLDNLIGDVRADYEQHLGSYGVRYVSDLEVHLDTYIDKPATCRVLRDGVVIFAGQDYSASWREPPPPSGFGL